MAKSKRKADRREEATAAQVPTAQSPSHPTYLSTSDPPRPNRLLLILAIVLFAAWLATLAAISFRATS